MDGFIHLLGHARAVAHVPYQLMAFRLLASLLTLAAVGCRCHYLCETAKLEVS